MTKKPAVAVDPHTILVERIKARMKALNLSMRAASQAAKQSDGYIKDVFDGSYPQPARMANLAAGLGCTVGYLKGADDPTWIPEPGAAPPEAVSPAAPSGEFDLYAPEWPDPDGWFKMPDPTSGRGGALDLEGGFALVVPDDSNAPRFRAGEIVCVNPRRVVGIGSFVLVVTPEKRAAIFEAVKVMPRGVDVRTLESGTIQHLERAKIGKLLRIVACREA